MNWKKLPKEKRNQLVLVVIVTLSVLSALGLGLIRAQYDGLKNLAEKNLAAHTKLAKMRDSVKNAGKYEATVTEARTKLVQMENDIASGDLYAWVINTVRRFKLSYRVEMPQFSPIGSVGDVTLLPDFPYKQATLTVAGSARFHDFGRFLADFENQFPHIRVLNLTLDANVATLGDDREALNFKMEIVTLVKPTQS